MDQSHPFALGYINMLVLLIYLFHITYTGDIDAFNSIKKKFSFVHVLPCLST